MKAIILSLFLLLQLSVFAQKKPTQAEINKAKQSQAAMQKEMDKELKELEADDPEMAKKIKEMMKQQGQPVKQTASAPVPKFISPITSVIVKQPVIRPTEEEATDRLLWYKGKKISGNILITTNGTLIQYKPQENEVVVQPNEKNDPFKKMVTELAKSENRKADLISNIAPKKNSFFYYPAIMNTLKEYDAASSDFNKILKNTISLPSPITTPGAYNNRSATGGYASFYKNFSITDIPSAIKIEHDEAMALMKNYPSIDFPEPPARDFSICYNCDSTVSKKYRQQADEWENEFSAYEVSVSHKAQRVIQALAKYNLDKDPEGINMYANMQKVLEFAMNRLRNKVDLLIRKYRNDFERLPLVVKIALSYERQKQLLGASDDTYSETMKKVISLMDGFENYIAQQMIEKNYNVVLNMAFIIGMERQKQLLGASDENPIGWFNKIMAFNRFRLNIDMDANVSGEDLVADAGALSSKDVYVSLGLNKCRFQFYLSDTDYKNARENDTRIPMTAKGGVKKQKEENDKWVSYYYSGPKDILGLFPPFSISFCDDEKDTVSLQPPINKPEDMSTVTANSVAKAYTIDHTAFLGGLFLKGTEESAGDAQEVGLELMAAYSADHLEKSTGNAALDALQRDYNSSVKTKELQDKMAKATSLNSVQILFDAQNKNELIVDAETSPSNKLDDGLTIKGKIKIKVIHDPVTN